MSGTSFSTQAFYKPSAFESEIHPSHKSSICTLGISPCRELSHAKQENLYAFYETTDRHYWTELARYNQQEFLINGTEGKCIEARELLPEPIEKIATRNMFYNEQGKHVRTRKEILDDNGNIRKGCKIIKKGEAYERNLFTAKNKLFKQEHYLDEAKCFYTDLINLLIEEDNQVRMQWNHEVDRAIVSQVPKDEIRQIKKEFITNRIRQSIEAWGNKPYLLQNIILTATKKLALLTSKVLSVEIV